MRGTSRSGFTLVETLIALVLSSIIIGLVSHTFLVQNRFYETQTLRVGAQDNARAATELIAREIRNTAEDGFVVAGRRTLTIRSPMVLGVICDLNGSGNNGEVLTEGGEAGVDQDEVAGLALRTPTSWVYVNATWATMNGSDATSAQNCFDNGADTVGAVSEFHRLTSLSSIFSSPSPVEGDVVMLFRETTFAIQQSVLDSTTLGLFRAAYGDSLVEFATGIDTTAQFQYRTGGTTYADTIMGAAVGTIDAVRIVADAWKRPPTGGVDPITFGWSVNVPLRNIR